MCSLRAFTGLMLPIAIIFVTNRGYVACQLGFLSSLRNQHLFHQNLTANDEEPYRTKIDEIFREGVLEKYLDDNQNGASILNESMIEICRKIRSYVDATENGLTTNFNFELRGLIIGGALCSVHFASEQRFDLAIVPIYGNKAIGRLPIGFVLLLIENVDVRPFVFHPVDFVKYDHTVKRLTVCESPEQVKRLFRGSKVKVNAIVSFATYLYCALIFVIINLLLYGSFRGIVYLINHFR